ncbi:hypothetical protein [Pseudoalteromonas denitrificans]|uniref:Uncharacterized protein n=1 Tax=Pseudoalteromonas denitrificans DSM 6059 TaxID=1123010 RepID=A0A1I1HEA8_9GAMM|nr:hypothetical protein [Pseudoalteromonas denitrificans]SFC20308.1 hypothetical protein SAMN02745724_01108 [Pseudoalteromonas denitrificans DSM 6059]
MPVEIVGDVFSGIFRFILRIFVEVIFEFLIKGVGYLFCRMFGRKVDPDGLTVIIVGLVIWGLVIFGGYQLLSFLEIDSCLDTGGKYNYELKECVLSD